MQAASRSHRMEAWRSSGKGDRSWGQQMAAIWTEAKARHCWEAACAELSGHAPLEKFSGCPALCLLEYDAVGAGSPLFVSIQACRHRPGSAQPAHRAGILACWGRHMHCCDASHRQDRACDTRLFLPFRTARAAVSVASRDLAPNVCLLGSSM